MSLRHCILPIPASLAKAGSKFVRPPLDGSMTVPQIYDWHYVHNPAHSVFVFKDIPTGQLKHLTYREVVPTMHAAARFVLLQANMNPEEIPSAAARRPTVGIVANTGEYTHMVISRKHKC